MRFLSVAKLKMMRYRTALALLLVLGTRAGVVTVLAQDVELPPVEKHLALIIANEDYNMDGVIQTGPGDMPPPGVLRDLANPCRDAKLFRQTLLDAHWQPEDITFPECNQTAAQMRELITKFRESVANTANTLAIFYYSGHGAQFSDADTNHSFLFGVGAKLDMSALATSWVHSPKNTSAIATQAIDLDELLTPLGGQPENAVFVVLDACRNNPLYGQIDELANAPAIAPLGAARDFNGILIAYSTPHGEFSGDGFGEHSIFTAALVKELRPARNLDSSLNSLRKAVDTEYKKAYPSRTNSQIPVVTGRFNGDWCLTQCTPPIARAPAMRAYGSAPPPDGAQTNTEIGEARSGVQRASFSSRALARAANSSVSHAMFSIAPKGALRQMAAVAPRLPSTVPQSASTRTIYDKDADKRDYSTPASTGMHFDVFWCDGGTGSAEREQRALDVASVLGQQASAPQNTVPQAINPNGLPVSSSIVSVRLRRLTALANTGSGFRYADNVVVYDKDDAHEVAWSKIVSNLGGADLHLDGDTAKTPNYMSIFICRAPRQQAISKTLIYLQVPSDNLKPSGHLLLRGITRVVPTVKDAGGIQTRTDGPLSTELRFYNEQERDSVFATAKVMEQVLKQPVKVQFIPRLASKYTAGHMEIWLGKSDPPLDDKALKAISPKRDPKE